MKKYKKAKVLAKNNPQGSYAAGCGSNRPNQSSQECKRCERSH